MQGVLQQADLVTTILACLPIGKHKLRLRLVCKVWKYAMEGPAAHSLKSTDCILPFAENAVARKVTQVLIECTVTVEESEVGGGCGDWLGSRLQMLDIHLQNCECSLHFLEALPVRHQLLCLRFTSKHFSPEV